MNSVLSLVSGQFTRSLIFGAFFPVVLFLVIGMVAIQPLLPRGLPVLQAFQNLDSKGEILALTFAAVVLTVFVYNLNIPIVRLFEGYPWRRSALGVARARCHQRRFEQLQAAVPRLRMIRDARRKINPSDPLIDDLQNRLDQLGRLLQTAYPIESGFVLPTRFGNVLRSFESYPQAQYGMDGVMCWPRLLSVIPKDVLAPVDEARSAVDFFVNGSILSATLAGVLFVVGCATTNAQAAWSTLIRWPLETLGLLLCAALFYQGAINRAAAWGSAVKSMFDLYRWDLLKKIGYQQVPATRVEERALWDAITKQMQFGDPPFSPPMPYKKADVLPPSTAVTPQPPDLGIALSGGVEPDWWGRCKYIYCVRNVDAQGRPAISLQLTIVLPQAVEYVWNSATVNGTPCQVTGLNPLLVDLGPLPNGEAVDVTWQVLPARSRVQER